MKKGKNSTGWTEEHLNRLKNQNKIRDWKEIGKANPKEPKKKNKYGNKVVVVDGERFDSKKEASVYFDRKIMQMAGEIKDLSRQQKFELNVDGKKVASYIADITYTVVATGVFVVEDVKSSATRKLPTYRLKKKLMKAIHGIDIIEV